MVRPFGGAGAHRAAVHSRSTRMGDDDESSAYILDPTAIAIPLTLSIGIQTIGVVLLLASMAICVRSFRAHRTLFWAVSIAACLALVPAPIGEAASAFLVVTRGSVDSVWPSLVADLAVRFGYALLSMCRLYRLRIVRTSLACFQDCPVIRAAATSSSSAPATAVNSGVGSLSTLSGGDGCGVAEKPGRSELLPPGFSAAAAVPRANATSDDGGRTSCMSQHPGAITSMAMAAIWMLMFGSAGVTMYARLGATWPQECAADTSAARSVFRMQVRRVEGMLTALVFTIVFMINVAADYWFARVIAGAFANRPPSKRAILRALAPFLPSAAGQLGYIGLVVFMSANYKSWGSLSRYMPEYCAEASHFMIPEVSVLANPLLWVLYHRNANVHALAISIFLLRLIPCVDVASFYGYCLPQTGKLLVALGVPGTEGRSASAMLAEAGQCATCGSFYCRGCGDSGAAINIAPCIAAALEPSSSVVPTPRSKACCCRRAQVVEAASTAPAEGAFPTEFDLGDWASTKSDPAHLPP
ncbi:hypothetical protein BC828DRAFT_402984 [Blastocladiella britannica]|nr:hypothetical protein BC828DRAFT_402984 [Blastocladiella britannica]